MDFVEIVNELHKVKTVWRQCRWRCKYFTVNNMFHVLVNRTNLNVWISLVSRQWTLTWKYTVQSNISVWAVSPAGPVCVSVPVNSLQSRVVSPSESPAESTNCSADEPQQQNHKHSVRFQVNPPVLGLQSHMFHLSVSSTEIEPRCV